MPGCALTLVLMVRPVLTSSLRTWASLQAQRQTVENVKQGADVMESMFSIDHSDSFEVNGLGRYVQQEKRSPRPESRGLA